MARRKRQPPPPPEPEGELEEQEDFEAAAAAAVGTMEAAVVRARRAVAMVSSEKTSQTRAAQASDEEEALEEAVEAHTPELRRRGSGDPAAPLRESLVTGVKGDLHVAWRARLGRELHEFGPGDELDAILKVEQRLHLDLPPSYVDTSLEFGTGAIFTRPWLSPVFISAGKVLDEAKGRLSDAMQRPFLPVLRLGGGDYLALDMGRKDAAGEAPVVWWSLESGAAEFDVAPSFAAFLAEYCQRAGDPYWLAAEGA